MDQHQTAITAAFVMEGLHRADYLRAVQVGDQGAFELVDAVMDYVPIIDALRAAADAVLGEDGYPGVFEYEVSSEYGRWLGTSLIEDGEMPERGHAVEILVDLVDSFFRVEDKEESRRLRAGLDAAANVIMAAAAANDGA